MNPSKHQSTPRTEVPEPAQQLEERTSCYMSKDGSKRTVDVRVMTKISTKINDKKSNDYFNVNVTYTVGGRNIASNFWQHFETRFARIVGISWRLAEAVLAKRSKQGIETKRFQAQKV